MEDKSKLVREKILNDVKKEIEELGATPTLAIIKVNNDYASSVYVKNKVKTCDSVGIKAEVIELNPDEVTSLDISSVILDCNITHNATILQLPLADKFKQDEHRLLNLIKQTHDIDGLTDVNKLKLMNNEDCLVPCTALAVFKIIEHELGTTDFSGKRVCIVNRSDLIGKPLMNLLLNHNATPTICHSKTSKDINNYLFNYGFDFVITGIGKHIINEDFLTFTTIIDCGISRDENGKLLRDIIRKYHEDNTYYGAVGTVTTACVAYNTLKAYKLQNGIN